MKDNLSFLDRGLADISFTVQEQLETSRGSLDVPANWEVVGKEALQLEPLFLFLSSSLNVELVYIILKSITQFTYINSTNGQSRHLSNSKLRNITIIADSSGASENMTLMLTKIKIKEYREWSRTSSLDRRASSSVEQVVLNMHCKVKVTFYKMQTFTDMFSDYFSDFEVLHKSLSPKYNRDMVFKAGEGAGRSGSFFFFSHDRKFIIKTMPKGELDLLLRLLPAFKEHYKKNPHSLLSKIFGVFTIETDKMDNVHLMLMENTLRLKDPLNLKYIFDLKGSLVSRKVKGQTKPDSTLKDINYLMAKK